MSVALLLEQLVAWLQRPLGRPEARTFSANGADDEMIMMVRVQRTPFPRAPGGVILQSIEVAEPFRRRGYAKRLVLALMGAVRAGQFVQVQSVQSEAMWRVLDAVHKTGDVRRPLDSWIWYKAVEEV